MIPFLHIIPDRMKPVKASRGMKLSDRMISTGRNRSVKPSPCEIRGIFGSISSRYVLMNTLMSFGQDRSWRRHLIGEAALPQSGRLLDVGTGTGDIAREAREAMPTIQVTAVDLTMDMMRVGRTRKAGEGIRWCLADALDLPFPNATFDAALSGYLVRNVTDIRSAFEEQKRVVKPGGRIVCLETSPPPRTIVLPLVRFYLKAVIPLLGFLLTGHRRPYQYLADSTQNFLESSQLASIMRDVGIKEVTYRRFMFGTQAVYAGIRP
jgi:demethylmenaquinone methyltransferase / 2-methoxy-6-polyprenyl-1,4-benzoquinol methylase